jgi:hypothetical protein
MRDQKGMDRWRALGNEGYRSIKERVTVSRRSR